MNQFRSPEMDLNKEKIRRIRSVIKNLAKPLTEFSEAGDLVAIDYVFHCMDIVVTAIDHKLMQEHQRSGHC